MLCALLSAFAIVSTFYTFYSLPCSFLLALSPGTMSPRTSQWSEGSFGESFPNFRRVVDLEIPARCGQYANNVWWGKKWHQKGVEKSCIIPSYHEPSLDGLHRSYEAEISQCLSTVSVMLPKSKVIVSQIV